jgi:unsaturated rhamnogalacturonyl hydrolase
MNRRTFINLTQGGCLGILISPTLGCAESSGKNEFERVILHSSEYPSHNIPEQQRVAFGWPAAGIFPGESVLLKPEKKIQHGNLWLRISVALEIRDIKLVKVNIPGVGANLGTLDIRFSSVLVPYELKIDAKHIEQINRYGLELTLDSPSPLWFFSEKDSEVDNSAFLPHILVSDKETGTVDVFLRCMESVNSVQAFGWREGTVLDGLWQLYAQKGRKKAMEAIMQHFALFFDGQDLHYETLGRSNPRINEIDGIESTIPFATLARLDADHPILKTVVAGWEKLKKPNGMVIDGTLVSAEGCYTVAYPMAVIGKAWNDKKLMKEALAQLKHRFVLYNSNILYLRYNNTSGLYTYPNWARGAAWNLLGFARTISELKSEMQDDEVIDKFQKGVELALSMQRSNGLWGCFMHKPDSLPDTSGSAGIAAAILTGIRNGFLSESYRPSAERCWNALQQYITPDGFLKGVAQDNRGGIELQESDYRVIAQMGMGLMSQLYAEL